MPAPRGASDADIGATPSALIASYSNIESDPRVRRQISWLAEAGWRVDTLGLGAYPADEIHDHFELAPPKAWTTTKWGTAFAHLLLPRRQTFRVTLRSRIPADLRKRVREGAYQLILLNETEFAPWIADRRDFTSKTRTSLLHIDLHEYHNPERRRNTFGGRLTSHHYRWVRNFIGHPLFSSRTVVNDAIGSIYADEFGFEPPVQVRNIPPAVDIRPSDVDAENIRLLFHGMPGMQRGFAEILEAMRSLPDRFSMTFMLMPNQRVHEWLSEEISQHPARARLQIVPPAPMREIAERINEYDLEIIFYRPLNKNLEFAQPNKFFESIQGRLGIVVAEGKTMAPIVREWENGVVVSGFEGADLADALASLTAEDVAAMKEASDRAAREFNAEAEGRRFLTVISGERSIR